MLSPQKRSELIKLVEKVLQDKATPEEKRFVEKYYDYFEKNGFNPEDLSDQEKKNLEDKILHRLYAGDDSHKKRRAGFLLKNNWMKAAAAACALIVTGSIYFYHHYSATESNMKINSVERYTTNDAAPGGNKAVLTLSNGSHIILDSVNNGIVAAQGNSRVSKVNSGQLVYNPMINGGRDVSEYAVATAAEYNTLATPRGGQYQLTLSDGTKVWLNSASSLTFPAVFSGKEREVILTGEAYFEVKENKNKPFKVKAGNMKVEVLGTHFDVMAYSDEPVIQTTLLEGSVRLTEGNKNALLYPGQKAIIVKGGPGRIRVSAAHPDMAVAWKDGYFSFHRTDIYEIMRRISRWYDVDVSYQDSLHVFFNGHISRNVNASEVFRMLEMTGELKFTIKGRKVTVKKRL